MKDERQKKGPSCTLSKNKARASQRLYRGVRKLDEDRRTREGRKIGVTERRKENEDVREMERAAVHY